MADPILFTVSVDGLTATVDALTPIVQGVNEYFTDPDRAIALPVPVFAGEWEEYKNTSDGPPGRVVIAQTDFEFLDGGEWAIGDLRFAPGDDIEFRVSGSSFGPPQRAHVVGVRAQQFRVVVQGLASKGAATDDAGAQYALDQVVAAYALADLTYAAIRSIHGHRLGSVRWTPMGAERGEFGYGSVLVGGFGPIPIPVLGDVCQAVVPDDASALMTMPPATTGDTVTR